MSEETPDETLKALEQEDERARTALQAGGGTEATKRLSAASNALEKYKLKNPAIGEELKFRTQTEAVAYIKDVLGYELSKSTFSYDFKNGYNTINHERARIPFDDGHFLASHMKTYAEKKGLPQSNQSGEIDLTGTNWTDKTAQENYRKAKRLNDEADAILILRTEVEAMFSKRAGFLKISLMTDLVDQVADSVIDSLIDQYPEIESHRPKLVIVGAEAVEEHLDTYAQQTEFELTQIVETQRGRS